MKGEICTSFFELADKMSQIKSSKDAEAFEREFSKEKKYEYFYNYLNAFALEHDVSMAHIVNFSRINKNYVYNITNGYKKHPSRDKIIALCISAGMNFIETNVALYLGSKELLNPYSGRDAWIAMCVNNKMGDALEVNLVLEERGHAILDL